MLFALELTYRRAISREDLVEASIMKLSACPPRRIVTDGPRWEGEMLQALSKCAPHRITGVICLQRAHAFTLC